MYSALDTNTRDDFRTFLERDINKELLRFTTAGSVDDGKSTLIGRLLHDAKAVYEDQLASVKKSKVNRSGGEIDFSLLTDGLRAEREQGITIDVAYRYFSTARRKFIIADTPGHEEYTRNMATGASTADLAIILVDATKGLLPQTRRHTHIASLLGIPNLLVAINKLDLLDFREEVFLRLEKDFLALAKQLEIPGVQCIPISALGGDNVATRSTRTAWYSGPTLLEHLETVEIQPLATNEEFRFPIQYVVRPDANFRGFAGRVASGTLRPGELVRALPSGRTTRLQSIVTFDGELGEATAGMSVTLKLEDEIDLSRGNMLVSVSAAPEESRQFSAMTVWMHAQPLELNKTYLLKHTTRQVKVQATAIVYRVDVNTFAHSPAKMLEMNGIACVEFATTEPLFFDAYKHNRTTGSFILVDPLSNATVGAGMIEKALARAGEANTFGFGAAQGEVTAQERASCNGHRAGLVLVNNLEEARLLERTLFSEHFAVTAVNEVMLSRESRLAVTRSLLEAGLLVIVAVGDLTLAEKKELAELAADSSLDMISGETQLYAQDSLAAVLAFAKGLRLNAPRTKADEVH